MTQPPFMPRKGHRHADRAIFLTELGEPFKRDEAPTPRGRLWNDLLLEGPGPRSPIWGPFVPWMSGQSVAVEFESGLLTQEKLSRFVAKAHLLRDASTLCADARFAVFCNQYPRERLRELKPFLSPGPCRGSWEINGGGLGRGMIVALRKLPLIDGTSVLRMIPEETRRAEGIRQIRHLLTDRKIPRTIKDAIMIALQTERFAMSDEWKHMGFYEYTALIKRRGVAEGEARGEAKGVAKGLAKGMAEGEAKAREVLLTLAASTLPSERVETLRTIRDLDLLGAEVQAALRERVR